MKKKTFWEISYCFDALYRYQECGGFENRPQVFRYLNAGEFPNAIELSKLHCVETYAADLTILQCRVEKVQKIGDIYV